MGSVIRNNPAYDQWRQELNQLIQSHCGLTIDDCPGFIFDWPFQKGHTPARTFRNMIHSFEVELARHNSEARRLMRIVGGGLST